MKARAELIVTVEGYEVSVSTYTETEEAVDSLTELASAAAGAIDSLGGVIVEDEEGEEDE